jgi:hypothetical protein
MCPPGVRAVTPKLFDSNDLTEYTDSMEMQIHIAIKFCHVIPEV